MDEMNTTIDSLDIAAEAAAPVETMDQYADELNATMRTINVGDILDGTVVGITDTEVTVDLQYAAEGIIRNQDYSSEPGFSVKENVKPGDEIKLDFDMKARLIMAKDGVNPEGKNFQAVQWGPLVLARDENIDPEYDRPVNIVSAADGTVEVRRIAAERPGTKVEFEVPTTTGTIRMVDYASVDCWEGSHVQTWLPVLK